MPWQWQNSCNGALGGTRTHRTWFLRPVRMPFRHQGMWWLWLVSIQPPRLMRAVRIHLRHTTEKLGCLTGIDPVLPLSQSRVQATTLKTPLVGSKGRIRTDGVRDLQSLALGHSATLLLLLERDIGIEPMTKDWKSLVLPLN